VIQIDKNDTFIRFKSLHSSILFKGDLLQFSSKFLK